MKCMCMSVWIESMRNKLICGIGVLNLFFLAVLAAFYKCEMLALLFEIMIFTLLPLLALKLKSNRNLGRQIFSIIFIFLLLWIGGIYNNSHYKLRWILIIYGLVSMCLSIGILLPLYKKLLPETILLLHIP